MPFAKAPAPADAGFTLVEVLVGIVLTAILVLGMTTLWAVIGDEFQNLSYRQKAVFALSGETERLAQVYRFAPPAPFTQGVLVGTSSRLIYAQGYNQGQIIDTNNDFLLGEVFYHDRGNGIGADDLNLVWLDRQNNVVAALSWTAPDLNTVPPADNPVAAAANCSAVPCVLLTVFIEYPYRFNLTDRSLVPPTKLDTISLYTIVARRGE